MRNERINDLRNLLRNRVNSHHDDAVEASEIEDPTLAAMQMSQDMGESKQARELLDLLPEPESEIVEDYRALRRVSDMEIEDGEADRVLHRLLFEKREAAREVVEGRLEIEERDGRNVLVKDPVSKMKYQFSEPEPSDTPTDEALDVARQHFVDNIIEPGTTGGG